MADNPAADTPVAGGLPVLPADTPYDPSLEPGPTRKGFGAGVSAVKSNLLGAGALVAHGIGATGAEGKLLAASGAASDEAAKSSRSLEDVDWTSPKSVTDHLKYVFGNALPSLALMAAGGVAGRGLGAMAGASGRALNAASLAGAVAPDVALEAGGIYPEAVKTGESNPALKSAVGGAAAASLDFLSVPAAVRRLMPEVKAVSKGGFGAAAKGFAKEAPKVGAIEAGQEFGQSVIERYSAGQSLTDKDAISDYANSAFGGFVPGVAIGGVAGGFHAASRTAQTLDQVAAAVPAADTPVETPTAPVVSPAPVQNVGSSEQVPTVGNTPLAIVPDERDMTLVPKTTPLEDAHAAHDAVTQEHASATAALESATQKVASLAAAEPTTERPKRQLSLDRRAAAEEVKAAQANLDGVTSQLEAAKNTLKTHQILAETPNGINPAIQPKSGIEIPRSGIIETKPPTDAEQVQRAVFREQGMPLTTTRESLATPAQTPREVALARTTESTPREVSKQVSARVQQGAIEAAAVEAAQPAIAELVAAKNLTPGAQTKLTRVLTDALNSIAKEAATKPTAQAAQQHIGEEVVKALKGRVKSEDAATIAATMINAVSQAHTLYSKGAAIQPGTMGSLHDIHQRMWEETKGNTFFHGSAKKLASKLSVGVGKNARRFLHEEGIWLAPNRGRDIETDTPSDAIRYSGSEGTIVHAKVDLKNPYHGSVNDIISDRINAKWLRDRGYDGFVDTYTGSGMVVALDPAQITEIAREDVKTGAITQNSLGALTSEQFHALPEPARNAAVDAYDAVMTERGNQLINRIRDMIGDRAGVQLQTFTAAPGSPIGGYTRTGPMKAIIAMALNAKNGLSIADHEGFHAAEDMVLNSAEREIVRNAFKTDGRMFKLLVPKVQQYDRENKTHLADEVTSIPAEARAYGFEFWKRGELQADGALARVFEKIKAFFERVANAVKGLGFQNVDDVFKALDLGQYSERQQAEFGEPMTRREQALASRGSNAPQTESAEFKRAIGNRGTFDPNSPDILRSIAEASPAPASRAWLDATKPESVGKLVKDFGGTELTAQAPLSVVQASMLPMLKHDQVRAAVVQALPVNVVDILTNHALPPEQLISKPNVVSQALSVDLRSAVSLGLGDALMQVRAQLRAALDRVLPQEAAGREEEILPALHAYQLDSREIVRLLSPLTLADTSADTGGLGSAQAATEAPVGGAALDVAGVGDELSPAGLALALNRHDALQNSRTGNLVKKFRPPAEYDLPTLFSKAAIEMDREAKAGDLQQQQLFAQFNRLVDKSKLSDLSGRDWLGPIWADTGGSVANWFKKHINTPNFIARFSEGYKNVYRTLNTYGRYKAVLVERMLKEQMPSWYDASQANRDAAFEALLKRTTEAYTKDSREYADLRASLTAEQQQLFDQANTMIAGFLTKELDVDVAMYTRNIADLEDREKLISDRREQVKSLIDTGYVPLQRYGDHTVHIYKDAVKDDGTPYKQTAGLVFRNSAGLAQTDAKMFEAEIARSGADLKVEVGTHYKAARDTTISVQQFLDTARRNGVPLTQAERERIVKALTAADSIMRNRLLRRQGTPGFSKDGMRVLHEFGVRTAGKIAYDAFAPAIDAAADGRTVTSDIVAGQPVINAEQSDDPAKNLWKQEGPMSGFNHNLADQLTDYVLVPDHTGEWSRKLRGAAMVYFIGGSISGGMVNAMSVPMMVIPELSIHTDYTHAFATTLSAWKTAWANPILRDINKLKEKDGAGNWAHPAPGVDEVTGLRQAMVEAADRLLDTEIHQIMGIAQGSLYSQSRGVQKAMEAWMAPFRISEQTNRITAFIAAYKVGQSKNMASQDLFKFAGEMVDATQNNYNEANRPGAARNPIYALMFMFKSFPLFMTEAIALMYKQSPKSAIYMLLGLTAMTGVQGLPFAEALEDLVDTISQQLFNSPFNTRRVMRNMIKGASEAMVGYDMSDIVLRGAINEVFGMSVSSRIGAGDFVPGTRLGTADADQGKILESLLGAPYAMVKDAGANIGGFVSSTATGDWKGAVDALRAGAPIALRNVIKGGQQLQDGYASDAGGRKLLDVNGPSAVFQMAGISSAGVARAYDLDKIDKQTKAFYQQVSMDMTNSLVRALKDGDTEKVQEIYAARDAWNQSNPDMPLMPNPAAVRRDMMLAGIPLNARTLRSLPRQLRGSSVSGEGITQ